MLQGHPPSRRIRKRKSWAAVAVFLLVVFWLWWRQLQIWFAAIILTSGTSLDQTQDLVLFKDSPKKDDSKMLSTPLPKILLYITTHFSDQHVQYFHCCWPQLVAKSLLIRNSHIMIAATNKTAVTNQELLHLESLFAHNPSYRFWQVPNATQCAQYYFYNTNTNTNNPLKVPVNYKQCIANHGLAAGMNFSKGYDWMIRINPDVLIRQSGWMLQSMQNATVQAILVHCGLGTKQLHTDFLAFRPNALHPNAFSKMAKIGSKLNHERTAMKEFRHVLAAAQHQWVPDTEPSQGYCRVRGSKAPVYHVHDSCLRSDDPSQNMVCSALQGWDVVG